MCVTNLKNIIIIIHPIVVETFHKTTKKKHTNVQIVALEDERKA